MDDSTDILSRLGNSLSGTYTKVVHHDGTWNPDSFIVLYLRPNHSFLFLGYWPGYESTVAAGRWLVEHDEVALRGKGIIRGDFNRLGEERALERTFRFERQLYTPTLLAELELPEWSLLGWRGSYTYIGLNTIFDPDRKWLPDSFESIDENIEQILGPDYSTQD